MTVYAPQVNTTLSATWVPLPADVGPITPHTTTALITSGPYSTRTGLYLVSAQIDCTGASAPGLLTAQLVWTPAATGQAQAALWVPDANDRSISVSALIDSTQATGPISFTLNAFTDPALTGLTVRRYGTLATYLGTFMYIVRLS